MPIESVYYGADVQASAGELDALRQKDMGMDALKQKLTEQLRDMAAPRGIDALTLLAFTDGKEAWYGAQIDKAKYRIVLEDETEGSVYLKIVKKPNTGEENLCEQ